MLLILTEDSFDKNLYWNLFFEILSCTWFFHYHKIVKLAVDNGGDLVENSFIEWNSQL